MRAAPDGSRCLDTARVSSQLPKLPSLAKKVVIVDAPRGSTSSSIEENLGFWIDEAAKTLVLADGTPLTVRRFNDRSVALPLGRQDFLPPPPCPVVIWLDGHERQEDRQGAKASPRRAKHVPVLRQTFQ
jgi:hypothetical protein